MGEFRLVSGFEAGPTALGILVPPGPRTVVILRPRSLALDLLLSVPEDAGTPAGPTWQLTRAQAAAVVAALQKLLARQSEAGISVSTSTTPRSEGGFGVEAQVGPYRFVAYQRSPGESYESASFASAAEAEAQARPMQDVLQPPDGVDREYYVNTHYFSR